MNIILQPLRLHQMFLLTSFVTDIHLLQFWNTVLNIQFKIVPPKTFLSFLVIDENFYEGIFITPVFQ